MATNPDSYRDRQVHKAFLFVMRHRYSFSARGRCANLVSVPDKYRGCILFRGVTPNAGCKISLFEH